MTQMSSGTWKKAKKTCRFFVSNVMCYGCSKAKELGRDPSKGRDHADSASTEWPH